MNVWLEGGRDDVYCGTLVEQLSSKVCLLKQNPIDRLQPAGVASEGSASA